jgi:hypothetical protein
MESSVTVIVELAIPTQRIVPGGRVEDPVGQDELTEKREAVAELIEEVVGSPPHWLKAARAFVVPGALPEQIKKIAASSLVKAVRPSTRIKNPR